MLGVVAVVLGWLIVGSAPEQSLPVLPALADNAGIPGSVPYVALASVCPYEGNDGRGLDVSFFVVNLATVELQIDQVRPWLPPRGLVTRAPATSGGSCVSPGTELLQARLAPNENRLFTLHLAAPTQCSSPWPILADVEFHAAGVHGSSQLDVYDDFARANKTVCPDRPVTYPPESPLRMDSPPRAG